MPMRLYEEVRGRRGAAVHFARIVLQAVDVGAQAGKAFLRKFVHARGKEAELVFPRVEDAALFVEELVHGAPGDGPGFGGVEFLPDGIFGELMPEIRHFAVHGVHEPQHQRFVEFFQCLFRGFVPRVQVLGGGVHDLPGLLQRGEGGGGKLFGVRVQHTEQFGVRQGFAVLLHMLAEPFAGGVGNPGVGFRDFVAVCLFARIPVHDFPQEGKELLKLSAAGHGTRHFGQRFREGGTSPAAFLDGLPGIEGHDTGEFHMAGAPAGFAQHGARLFAGRFEAGGAVQAVDVGQHADDADRASAAGQLAEQGQFGIGARIAGVHDEDDAVRLKAFLIGKIIMKLIGIIEAGRVHEHDARPERVQRQPHADAGHES